MTDELGHGYALAIWQDYPRPMWSVSARIIHDEAKAREYYKRELDGSYLAGRGIKCYLARVEILYDKETPR